MACGRHTNCLGAPMSLIRQILLAILVMVIGALAVPFAANAQTPTVTGVTPANGPLAGGGTVTITGTDFDPGTLDVQFGTTSTSFIFIDPNTITAQVPAGGAGIVDVVVFDSGSTPTATSGADQF